MWWQRNAQRLLFSHADVFDSLCLCSFRHLDNQNTYNSKHILHTLSFQGTGQEVAPFRATPSTSSSLAAATLKSAIQYVSPYTEWVSFPKMRKKSRNAGMGTAKQSVFLRIHIRANSQTKGLERGWKRRARLFSCFSLARLSLFLAPR